MALAGVKLIVRCLAPIGTNGDGQRALAVTNKWGWRYKMSNEQVETLVDRRREARHRAYITGS